MSGYNGRRGPNVSQYLRDLNTISPQDSTGIDESFSMAEDDLLMFTNSRFLDLDSGQNLDFQAPPPKVGSGAGAASNGNVNVTDDPDMSTMDFMSGDFGFSDYSQSFHAPAITHFGDSNAGFQPLQPNHGSVYSSAVATPQQQQQQQFTQPPTSRESNKRKADAIITAPSSPVDNGNLNLEDASRQAAEEDKRRRNTAASARFRIKKKQREQALEKSAKEASDKISSLESRVSQLETENKWLKNLLVEKSEGGAEDITTMWKEFTKHAMRRKQDASRAEPKAVR